MFRTRKKDPAPVAPTDVVDVPAYVPPPCKWDFRGSHNTLLLKRRKPGDDAASSVCCMCGPHASRVPVLRPDHVDRPIWVCACGTVFVESFAPFVKEAMALLEVVAEPVSRASDSTRAARPHVHKYRLTAMTLYAAASLGLTARDICQALHKFNKYQHLAPEVTGFVEECVASYGQVSVIIAEGQRYLLVFQRSEEVQAACDALLHDGHISVVDNPDELRRVSLLRKSEDTASSTRAPAPAPARAPSHKPVLSAMELLDAELELSEQCGLHMESWPSTDDAGLRRLFDVSCRKLEALKDQQPAAALDGVLAVYLVSPGHLPRVLQSVPMLITEYCPWADSHTPSLPVRMRKTASDEFPAVQLRPYQEQCMQRVFSGRKARSGVVVLPCGAGKTLVAVQALATVGKSAFILCPNNMSVNQWVSEIRKFTQLDVDKYVRRFTSTCREPLPPPDTGVIVVSTYSMMSFRGQRNAASSVIMNDITSPHRRWGTLILDEVHILPAETYRQTVDIVQAQFKLGLTATPVREDGEIEALYYLVGPKLYEANWMTLTEHGYLAPVQCIQVECPFPPASRFYVEYLRADKLPAPAKESLRKRLCAANPTKLHILEYLVRRHLAAGDKIIVFSDNLFALQVAASTMAFPFLCGSTTDKHRSEYLQQFRAGGESRYNVLFMSTVGDMALDVPDANVLIQLSSNYGSQRQEAQRMGRILRVKPSRRAAMFYSLLTKDTMEATRAMQRHQFLCDQGYSYRFVRAQDMYADFGQYDLCLYKSPESQAHLLEMVMSTDVEDERVNDGFD